EFRRVLFRSHSMGGLRGGEDSFEPRAEIEAGQRVAVGNIRVTHAARVFPVAVLGPNSGVVEPGRYGMHVRGLAVLVLQNIAVAAMQYARLAKSQGRG